MSASYIDASLWAPPSALCYELEDIAVRVHALTEYELAWRAMQKFTENRGPPSRDQIWTFEHPSVFTLGQAGDRAHILDPREIPVITSDRGGQATYHGPGQLVVYVLVDLRRRGLGVRHLVRILEQSVIDLLAAEGIDAGRRPRAPGVYVGGRKVAALGLRVKRGCSYHGLALNVSMDLRPFSWIDPCGYAGLEVTQLADLGVGLTLEEARGRIVSSLAVALCEPGGEGSRT